MAEAAGAVIGIGSSLFGMSQQRKAMEEQKKAMKEQKNLQRTADARERRQLLRQQAIARGQTVNVAAQLGGGQGASMGSAVIGGLAGLENQALSSIGFQAASAASVNRQQRFLNKASQYQTNAGIAEGVGALGSGLMSTSFGSLYLQDILPQNIHRVI
jgi:hypothetical protein